MRILFLTTVLPSGRFGGGEIWSQSIIDALRAGGATVVVLGYDRRAAGAAPGEQAVAERQVETARNPLSAARWGAEALMRNRPYTVQKWVGHAYQEAVDRELETGFDFAVIDHARSAWLVERLGDLPFVHLSHQAEGRLYGEQAASRTLTRLIHLREARLISQIEQHLARRALEIWVLGEGDRCYFDAKQAGKVRVLPATARPLPPLKARRIATPDIDVGLLGSWTWPPNRQSLSWFLANVVPALPNDWTIEIAGKRARNAGQHPRVKFAGVVPDAFEFLQRCRRIAVPSHSSTGISVKLLDSIAAGPPVVTTIVAAGLIGPLPGHVTAVDDASAFARALIDADTSHLGEGRRWVAEREALLHRQVADALAAIASRLGQRAWSR